MDEAEIIEIVLAYLPETLEGWAGLVMGGCAILSFILPPPAENASKLVRAGHRLICVLGFGAGKLRVAGKIGKIANLIRRKQ